MLELICRLLARAENIKASAAAGLASADIAVDKAKAAVMMAEAAAADLRDAHADACQLVLDLETLKAGLEVGMEAEVNPQSDAMMRAVGSFAAMADREAFDALETGRFVDKQPAPEMAGSIAAATDLAAHDATPDHCKVNPKSYGMAPAPETVVSGDPTELRR